MATADSREIGAATLAVVGPATGIAAKAGVESVAVAFVEETFCTTTVVFGTGCELAGTGFVDDAAAAAV